MKPIRDKINLTGEQILLINENAPEKLFSGDLETAKSEYHAFSRRWHPDHNDEVRAVIIFQHIAGLYRKAQESIKAKRWRGAGVLELPIAGSGAAASRFRQISYFKRVDFELGAMYLGATEIAFAVER